MDNLTNSYSIVGDLTAASSAHQWQLACLGLVIFLVMLKMMKILSGTKFFELIKGRIVVTIVIRDELDFSLMSLPS